MLLREEESRNSMAGLLCCLHGLLLVTNATLCSDRNSRCNPSHIADVFTANTYMEEEQVFHCSVTPTPETLRTFFQLFSLILYLTKEETTVKENSENRKEDVNGQLLLVWKTT